MLLFLPAYRANEWKTPYRWLLFSMSLLVSSITVFAFSPPDNFTDAYDSDDNLQIDLFNELLGETPLDSLNLKEGKQVLCFFSTGCNYCQMAAQKLSLMQSYYGFPADHITFVFMGSEEGIVRFYEKSQSAEYRNVLYDNVINLLKAIDGQFPTLVFMKEGDVVYQSGFRDMKESEIKSFFTQP